MTLEAFTPAQYDEARRLALSHRHGSASLLQRAMRMQYTPAKHLVDALTSKGILTPPTKAGLRLLVAGQVPQRDFTATVVEKHVRVLRDLALYLLECEEIQAGPDSRCTAMILHPIAVPVRDLYAAAVGEGRGAAPVFAIAEALAKLPQLESPFSAEVITVQLKDACAPFERRAMHIELDDQERLRRGLIQLARYLEKRLLDGWGAHTRAFEYFVRDELLPQGRGRAGGGHREHVVPCAFLRDRCMDLLRTGVSCEVAAEWMRPYLAIVLITPQQANTLDVSLGLKTCMPEGWRFDADCIFARLHAAAIAFDPPAGYDGCVH